jgi:radical SAM protein with 4Fe4S-binding SPASM domain
MILNIQLAKCDLSCLSEFSKLDLRIPSKKLAYKEKGTIFNFLDEGYINSLIFNNISENLDFLNEMSELCKIKVIINSNTINAFIAHHMDLFKNNLDLIIVGDWNEQTINLIKKTVLLGYSATVIFKTINTISQASYIDLFNFIFLNPLQIVKVDPFSTILLAFFHGYDNFNLFDIYNNNPNIHFYADKHGDISCGLLGIDNKKTYGNLKEGISKLKSSVVFNELTNIYNSPESDNSECQKCLFNSICRGYIKVFYNDECSDWKEMFYTIMDFSKILKNNLPLREGIK